MTDQELEEFDKRHKEQAKRLGMDLNCSSCRYALAIHNHGYATEAPQGHTCLTLGEKQPQPSQPTPPPAQP